MRYEALDSICKVAAGGTPSRSKTEYWEDGSIPWIKIGNIKSKYVSEADEYITESGLNNSSAKLFAKGTILYTIFATLGEVGILDMAACTNQAIAGISIEKSKLMTTDYLYYYLKSKKAEVNQMGRGVAQNNINLSILRKFSIPVRDQNEQERIVETLNHIEAVIENKKTELANLDNLIKARFVEMFKGKYDSFKVDEKLKTTSGGTPKSSVSEYYDGGDIPWLTSGEVNYGGITKPSNYITEKGLNNSSAKWVPENSIVIAMYGATAGKVGIVRYKTTTNQAVCSILPNDNFNQEFLRYAFQDISEELTSKAIGGGQPNISQTIIKNSYIVDAPIEEQERFASFAKQIDKSKFAVQKSLEKTQLLFDSLMQEYFG